jgi:hypothetical protein
MPLMTTSYWLWAERLAAPSTVLIFSNNSSALHAAPLEAISWFS